MKKCINRCENGAMNLILGRNDFKFDSGASEKHFIFFYFWSAFLNFRPALRHEGWCQNIARRSPKLFGKTSFLTLQTFLEHVRNMSKTCIVSCLILSYDIIWYHIKWYHMISYHMTWYHIIWYDIIWYHMIWCHMIS